MCAWKSHVTYHTFFFLLEYHCKPINQLAVSYSAVENNVLATCSNDGTATIWSVSPNGKTGSGMICELDTNFYSDPCVDCIDFGHGASEDMLFLGINNQDMDHPGYVRCVVHIVEQP